MVHRSRGLRLPVSRTVRRLPIETCVHVLSIAARRHLREPAEDHAKVTLIAESDFQTNLGYGHVRRGQQLLSLRNPKGVEVLHEGFSGELYECAPEG